MAGNPLVSAAAARYLPTITPAALSHHLLASPRPLHLGRDLVASWRALTDWKLEDGVQGIRWHVGDDTGVEVELGRPGLGYIDKETQRISMPFGLFLDAFILGRIPHESSTTPPSAYLAQSDLLTSYPGLLDDVSDLPHYRSGPQGSMYRRTIWIGPRGSFTPFHRDPYIGLFSQIVGKKKFWLLPPEAKSLLDLSTDPLQRNTSTIPLTTSELLRPPRPTADKPHGQQADELDLAKLQRYRKNLAEAFQLDGSCFAELQPGESILVPEGWWHSAEGGETSGVGVGAWFR